MVPKTISNFADLPQVVPYSYIYILQTDDKDSVSLGIHKSLIFLSPAGRGYYLRDDPISDGTSNTGGTGSINITSFTGQIALFWIQAINMNWENCCEFRYI